MATYGSEQGVEGINAHQIGGYTASTTPTSAQVAVFLTQGASLIDTALARAGYVVPVASTATCYQAVVRLNDLFAAAAAEQAVNISDAMPGQTTRSDKLWQAYEAELKYLLEGDLTTAGVPLTTSAASPRKRIRSLPTRHFDGYAVNADDLATDY